MDTIVCNFKLYELHQPIELMNSNVNLTLIAVSNFESLADDITKACEKYKTNKIHLAINFALAKPMSFIPREYIKLASFTFLDFSTSLIRFS